MAISTDRANGSTSPRRCSGALLWGLWHLPTLPAESRGPEAVIALLGVHALIGVPLAIYWRQSGNLAVPAFTHAMIDAVRNALRVTG